MNLENLRELVDSIEYAVDSLESQMDEVEDLKSTLTGLQKRVAAFKPKTATHLAYKSELAELILSLRNKINTL